MTTPPSKQLDQFVVRLPDGMRDRIKAAADANNRSMNAEIVATLEEKYPAPFIRFSDLGAFLQILALGAEGMSDEDHAEYIKLVNGELAKQAYPFTIERGDLGSLAIYPYPTPSDD